MGRVSDMLISEQEGAVDELLCEIDHWKDRADEATALLKEALAFLNSIEGAGYGGMAAFEVPRGNIRAFLENKL